MQDDMEPQNKLTEQFTEAEWKALKQLRAALSDIFADAFPYKPDARETSIDIWGVTLNPQSAKLDARVSIVLMKFLRAKGLNFPGAWDMLKETLRWRDRFDIDGAMKEEFSPKSFGQVTYIHGHDKEERPVVYQLFFGGKEKDARFADQEKYIRKLVATAERRARQLDFNEVDQFLNITDLAEYSLKDSPTLEVEKLKGMNQLIGKHYPGLAYRSFIVNASFMLRWGMETAKEKGTVPKELTVIGTGKSTIRKALLPFIDAKELPKRYGGESDAF